MSKLKVLGHCLCTSILALGLSACPGNPCEEVDEIVTSCENTTPNEDRDENEIKECNEIHATCAQCMLDADIDCDNFFGVALGCGFSGKCVSDEENSEPWWHLELDD